MLINLFIGLSYTLLSDKVRQLTVYVRRSTPRSDYSVHTRRVFARGLKILGGTWFAQRRWWTSLYMQISPFHAIHHAIIDFIRTMCVEIPLGIAVSAITPFKMYARHKHFWNCISRDGNVATKHRAT